MNVKFSSKLIYFFNLLVGNVNGIPEAGIPA